MRATGNGGVFCLVSPNRRMRDVEHLMLWKGSASLQAVRAYKHATGRRLWALGFGLWASGFGLRASGFGLRAAGNHNAARTASSNNVCGSWPRKLTR
ncbi:hypothetical protein NXS97_04900 [Pantoea sp. B623]|uniref:hypothetical protein n=1 Tax=Pantoea sp. B623 TaxID=2974561 RepID=UPI002168DF4C|nr:hypothetical protein [Pantoea sp. B623]MCS4493544.1 hypothetical protein [Pantoea sp. B623]